MMIYHRHGSDRRPKRDDGPTPFRGASPFVRQAVLLPRRNLFPAVDPLHYRRVCVHLQPERQPEPPTQLLRRVYGLTNAEVDVALRVLRGDGLKPICAELSLSMATVKTHLQHIFDKTETHRRAELVRLQLTIIP
jgi:DNA-binding CsgD family transcriptional regulator